MRTSPDTKKASPQPKKKVTVASKSAGTHNPWAQQSLRTEPPPAPPTAASTTRALPTTARGRPSRGDTKLHRRSSPTPRKKKNEKANRTEKNRPEGTLACLHSNTPGTAPSSGEEIIALERHEATDGTEDPKWRLVPHSGILEGGAEKARRADKKRAVRRIENEK